MKRVWLLSQYAVMGMSALSLALGLWSSPAGARSGVKGVEGGGSSGTLFKCSSRDGVLLYTNQRESGYDCKPLAKNYPISTFTSGRSASGGSRPADFPKVREDEQKTRDNDRKAILQQELANEQRMLDDARRTLGEQKSLVNEDERTVRGAVNAGKVQERVKTYEEAVDLHQRNVDALQKELSR